MGPGGTILFILIPVWLFLSFLFLLVASIVLSRILNLAPMKAAGLFLANLLSAFLLLLLIFAILLFTSMIRENNYKKKLATYSQNIEISEVEWSNISEDNGKIKKMQLNFKLVSKNREPVYIDLYPRVALGGDHYSDPTILTLNSSYHRSWTLTPGIWNCQIDLTPFSFSDESAEELRQFGRSNSRYFLNIRVSYDDKTERLPELITQYSEPIMVDIENWELTQSPWPYRYGNVNPCSLLP